MGEPVLKRLEHGHAIYNSPWHWVTCSVCLGGIFPFFLTLSSVLTFCSPLPILSDCPSPQRSPLVSPALVQDPGQTLAPAPSRPRRLPLPLWFCFSLGRFWPLDASDSAYLLLSRTFACPDPWRGVGRTSELTGCENRTEQEQGEGRE